MDEEALAWASRLDAGLAPREQAAFARWLARDPAHEWRLAHYRQFYAQLHGTVPALLAAGRVSLPPARAPRRVRPLIWGAGLAAAAAAMVLGGILFFQRPLEVSTPAAQRQSLVLADGSHADLNARTALSVRLRGSERRVRLERGEAYFEVAKDSARPFFVETPTGTVRVTGTKFNVRIDPPGSLAVTVLEGSVAVSTSPVGEPQRDFKLGGQDQVTFEGGLATQQRLTATTAENTVAWREGKIAFEDTPLAVALERFAAYHGRRLTVAPEAAGLLIGGRYTLDDLDAFLAAVERMLPVRMLRGEGGAVRFIATGRGAAPR